VPQNHFASLAFLMLALAQATGCSPAYMIQATSGHMAVARASRPVREVLADPNTPADLRRKLEGTQDVLRFAHSELALPDNGSYRDYADIKRPFAVWNVFAAAEYSLALRAWCFPFAGCVSYRGYFEKRRADEFAADLSARGDDVYVGGAAAYSTLGFFRDPILSSVARLPDTALAAVIFHELAHQQLYVPGDTVFSESFATLVEQEGMTRWLASRADQSALCAYLQGLERERDVYRLIGETRSRLAAIYSSGAPPADIQAAKADEFDRLRAQYRRMREGWREPPYFDGWFSGALNNATLGALAAYDQLVGTLRVILAGEGGDMRAFYRRAERLRQLGAADRAAVLEEITTPIIRRSEAGCPNATG
jgi:predicted aminopeptidase